MFGEVSPICRGESQKHVRRFHSFEITSPIPLGGGFLAVLVVLSNTSNFFYEVNRRRPAVTGGRQEGTTHVEVSRKKDATGARTEGHVARRCEASCRRHSQLETSRASAVHAALPLRSSAQSHVDATNNKHQQVRGQSGATFVDGGPPCDRSCLLCFSEKPTTGQAETCLGSASGRFRVPIGASNQASRCLKVPPARLIRKSASSSERPHPCLNSVDSSQCGFGRVIHCWSSILDERERAPPSRWWSTSRRPG